MTRFSRLSVSYYNRYQETKEVTQVDDKEQILTLVIETIDTVYASAFMVATKQKEVLRIFDLVSKQKTDCL